MKIEKFKPLYNFLGVVLLFVVLSLAYFSPVLKGFQLPQMDNTHAIGMAHELAEYETKTGEQAMWTNSMFGGMPAFQIKGDASANIFSYFNRFVRLGLPYQTAAILFLYLLGFFVLLKSQNISNWLSVLGAVAFAFGSYNIIIIMAGHITKAYAIALMGPVIAGILYTLNRDKWVGALFTAIALGAQIAYNHVQITYYLFILVLVLMIVRLIYAWREGLIKDFMARSGLLAGAALLAILPNLPNLWPTYEYGKFSIRGPSELATSTAPGTGASSEKPGSGLDRDYAFAWSYGRMETFTLLIPNLMGGASEALSQNPEVMQKVDSRLSDIVGQQSQYWGSKPFTSGPVYVGALVCFLFVLALFFYHGREKWWLLGATLLSILLSWGNNLEWFNYFMFDYFPMYNKFRTVEMTLVVATVTIPLLALLGLHRIVSNPVLIREKSNWFLAAFALTGGVALLFYLFPNLFFNFLSTQEWTALGQQKQAMPQQAAVIDEIIHNMQTARASLLKADALRSFLFILLGSGSLWLYATNRISKKYLLPGLALLVLIDLWGVDRRYLSNDDFVPPRKIAQQFTKSTADEFILQDKEPYFRVFSIYRNPFTEVNTSYFHKSIGGYHGAKLKIYQDVIDRYLQGDWQTLLNLFREGGQPAQADSLLAHMPVLNMLNTKYIIVNPNQPPLPNPYALGNSWFVKNIRVVASADEEIAALGEIDPASTAVIRDDWAGKWTGYSREESVGKIELTAYAPDKLKFRSESPVEQPAIFSDIYYPKGWKAYLDGNQIEIKRVNYILRGLMVPAGNHTIEFKFEPQSFYTARVLAIIGGIIILILLVLLVLRLTPTLFTSDIKDLTRMRSTGLPR